MYLCVMVLFLGFEDIISNGDGDFCTAPTHGTNSSTSTPNQKHVLKTTTIIHGLFYILVLALSTESPTNSFIISFVNII